MEKTNLAEAEPETFKELSDALNAQLERYRAVPWQSPK